MKRLPGFFLILILFSNLSCSNEKADKDGTNYNLFLQYMKETFNEKEFAGEMMFVIIPCSGCDGCEQATYSIFIDRLVNSKDFILIICNPKDKGLLSPTLKSDNIKYDFLSKMTEYDFGYGYPSCIIVKDNEVVSMYDLSPDIIHWLVKFQSIAEN